MSDFKRPLRRMRFWNPALRCTLIYIGPQDIVRADFHGPPGSSPTNIERIAIAATTDLTAAVQRVVERNRKLRGRVWILTTTAWTQSVPLSGPATRGLTDEELRQAAAFEMEPLSGLSAAESAVALVPPSHEDLPYWAIQLPASAVQATAEIISRHGGQLVGILHPGGVPRPFSPTDPPTTERRVELWPETVVVVERLNTERVPISVINADPHLGTWNSGIPSPVPDDHVPTQTLISSGSFSTKASAQGTFASLEDSDTLRSWLTAWHHCLTTEPEQVPIVRPRARPASALSQTTIAASLAAATFLACLGYDIAARAPYARQIPALEQQVLELDRLHQEVASRAQSTPPLEKKCRELLQVIATLKTQHAQLQHIAITQRRRPGELLRKLSQFGHELLVVRRIDTRGGETIVQGLSLQPSLSLDLATELDASLREVGWTVRLAQQEGLGTLTDGGPWRFELRLSEPPDAPLPSAPRSVAVMPSRKSSAPATSTATNAP